MTIKIDREFRSDLGTIGKLYLDNKYFCDTKEQIERDDEDYVEGETAIPDGVYTVELEYQDNLFRNFIVIKDVPNFGDVRICDEAAVTNTEGCIIVGKCDPDTAKVTYSTKIYRALLKELEELEEYGETFTLILNKYLAPELQH